MMPIFLSFLSLPVLDVLGGSVVFENIIFFFLLQYWLQLGEVR